MPRACAKELCLLFFYREIYLPIFFLTASPKIRGKPLNWAFFCLFYEKNALWHSNPYFSSFSLKRNLQTFLVHARIVFLDVSELIRRLEAVSQTNPESTANLAFKFSSEVFANKHYEVKGETNFRGSVAIVRETADGGVQMSQVYIDVKNVKNLIDAIRNVTEIV